MLALVTGIVLAVAGSPMAPEGLAARSVTIPAETMVVVRVTEKLTPGKIQAGESLPFVVDKDVVINGRVVIRASEPVDAIATDVQKKSTWKFRQGRLDFVIRGTRAIDGSRVELRNFKDYSQTGETPSFGHAFYSNPKVKADQTFLATVKVDSVISVHSSDAAE